MRRVALATALVVAFVCWTVVIANVLWNVSPWLAIAAIFALSGFLTYAAMREGLWK